MRREYVVAARHADLALIWRDWSSAIAKSDADVHITAHPAWSEGLWFRHAAEETFRLLAIYEDDELAFVMPYLATILRCTTRVDCIAEIVPFFSTRTDGELFRFALDMLAQTHGTFSMILHLVESSREDVAAFINTAQQLLGRTAITRSDDNVIVQLDAGWEAYQRTLSPNTREAIRSARARLHREKRVARFQCFASPADVVAAFDRALDIDSRSWKYVRGGAMTKSNEHGQFRYALEKLAVSRMARVFILEIDGVPAAFILGAAAGDRAWLAIWTYADDLSYFRPGRLLMAWTLEHLVSEGVRVVDFWGRGDRFKSSWSSKTIGRVSMEIGKHAARESHVAPVVARVRYAFGGHPQRYRFRFDAPSLTERLMAPFARRVRTRRLVAAYDHLPLRGGRPCETGVKARDARESDKCFIPEITFGSEWSWLVFARGDEVMASAPVQMSGEHLLVQRWWFRTRDRAERAACVASLLALHPRARCICEPRSAAALRSSDSAIALLTRNPV